ncbi:MarR family winged helix-turn-helix transcriptional regulator [Enterovirga aerilata]|uniref:MarR family transcriptional regulator n=1 Tax=Enterovirga aerilata TaxID=2730920 RepID=A0A849I4R6_9HYPH|nr:MarR family transcriptional regulator [Enterovirga sp. DB1703]NNM71379.1 MarR family transcriptional regulator [Enterovirga sp. DB1703]
MAKARAQARAAPPTVEPGSGPVLDLRRYVPGLLTFLANKLSRSASALYQREFGVNVTEWRIMSQLAIEPGIPASRICQVIGFDKGPVSRSLAAMEKRGIVTIEVDKADARRRVIALTGHGRALHDRIIAVALERERRLLACLSAEERELLIASLNAMHENLSAVNRPLAVAKG